MEPVREFFNAKAIRQLYEYAGFGKPESLAGCIPPTVTTFFLIILLGVRGPPAAAAPAPSTPPTT